MYMQGSNEVDIFNYTMRQQFITSIQTALLANNSLTKKLFNDF